MININKPFNNSLSKCDPRDVFNFMNEVNRKFYLQSISIDIDVYLNDVEITDGFNDLMTTINFKFKIFFAGSELKFVYKIHRSKDFTCSNSQFEKIN